MLKSVFFFLTSFLTFLTVLASPTKEVLADNPRLGSDRAEKGGELVYGVANLPKSLNYLISGDQSSSNIFFLVVETLCERNLQSGEFVPLLAERWKVSKDQKEFVFYLDKKAKYPDGSPVVAEDLLAYWKIVRDPDNLVGGRRTELDNFVSFDAVDQSTIKVKAKEAHYANLSRLCKVAALDRRFFLAKDSDFNKSFNLELFGSGPYKIVKVKKGHEVHLLRNKSYWGANLPQNVGRYNFDRVIFKKVADRSIQFELFKKGEIDMFVFNMAKRWKQQTQSEGFSNNWLIARKIENSAPSGLSGVMLNTRLPLFSDRRVREALAHSFNRKKFITELFFDSYEPLSSYYPNSFYQNPDNKMIPYDLKKARELLALAGWRQVNDKGWLVRGESNPGREKIFSFEMLYTSKTAERYLTTWQADLKKVGVQLNLKLITWPALAKLMESYQYQATWMGFSGNFDPDPYSNWHSKFKNERHGNNYSGFSDAELDRLIEELKSKTKLNERIKVFHQIDRILFENHPFVLSWHLDHIRLGYWNKFGFVSGGAPRFAKPEEVWQYVWQDAKKTAALQKAISQKQALAADPEVVGPNP